jgi:uncharacterized membrane protein
MTLLVLNLGAGRFPTSGQGSLRHVLHGIGPELFSYALSFAVVARLWTRHHAFFRDLSRIDAPLTALNLTYLALISFTPFPTRLLGLFGDKPAAVAIYAVTVGSVVVISAAMVARARSARLFAPGTLDRWRTRPLRFAAAVFALSVPVAFLSTVVAQAMWIVTLGPRSERQRR